MRIALITDGIWPYVIGGMQKHSFFLCKYLAKSGVHVILVHPYGEILTENQQLLSPFTPEEQEYISEIQLENPITPKFPGHYLLQSYRYSRKAYHALSGKFGSIDFIIAQGLTGWYFVNHKLEKPPVAIHCHGYEFLQKKADMKSQLESALLYFPFRLINQKADFVFSLGGTITKLIKRLSVPERRIIEMPGGIEEEWSVQSPPKLKEPRKFVFVGRNERRKGIRELSTALCQLKDHYEFEFHFVGPIPEKEKILSKNIIYHGTLTGKDSLQAVLQNCHVLVCPSYAEGLPTVIIEGMANGCAIIASDVGAIDTLVNSSCGILVEPGKPTQISEAMIQFIQMNTAMLESLRQNAILMVKENFLWPKIISNLIVRIKSEINEAS